MSDIEARVKKIVAEQLGVNEAEVKTASSFVDDLGADSLKMNSVRKSPTRKPRRSPRFNRPSISSRRIRRADEQASRRHYGPRPHLAGR